MLPLRSIGAFAGPLLLALGMATADISGAAAQTTETSDTLRVTVGRSRTVRLPETSGTGYGWRIDPGGGGSNAGVVRVSDRGFTPRPAGNGPRIGGAGTHAFRITGIVPGTARVTLVYVRPWEPASPGRRRVLTVEVVPR
jgi:predicted secreted protein